MLHKIGYFGKLHKPYPDNGKIDERGHYFVVLTKICEKNIVLDSSSYNQLTTSTTLDFSLGIKGQTYKREKHQKYIDNQSAIVCTLKHDTIFMENQINLIHKNELNDFNDKIADAEFQKLYNFVLKQQDKYDFIGYFIDNNSNH